MRTSKNKIEPYHYLRTEFKDGEIRMEKLPAAEAVDRFYWTISAVREFKIYSLLRLSLLDNRGTVVVEYYKPFGV